jgi:hypothetical protein
VWRQSTALEADGLAFGFKEANILYQYHDVGIEAHKPRSDLYVWHHGARRRYNIRRWIGLCATVDLILLSEIPQGFELTDQLGVFPAKQASPCEREPLGAQSMNTFSDATSGEASPQHQAAMNPDRASSDTMTAQASRCKLQD